MRLNDNFAGHASLFNNPRDLIQRPHFVARAGHFRDLLTVQFCDVGFQVPAPSLPVSLPRKRNQSLVASAIRDAVHTGASRQ